MEDPNKKEQQLVEKPVALSCDGCPGDFKCGSADDVTAVTTLKQEHAAMLIAENLLLTRSNQSLQEKCDIFTEKVQRLEREVDRLSAVLKAAPSARTRASGEPMDEHSLGQRLVHILADNLGIDKDGPVQTEAVRRLIQEELKKMFSGLMG